MTPEHLREHAEKAGLYHINHCCRSWKVEDLPLIRFDALGTPEQFTSLLSSSVEVTRLQGWQPFETAPTNGTEILVYRPDAGVFTAHCRPSLNEDREWDEDNCWRWFAIAGDDLTGDLPTHWMLMPNGPDEEGGTQC